MKMLHLVMILLTLHGVLTNPTWGVNYLNNPICAVRGFSVSVPCRYSYPKDNQVTQKLWCSMNTNTERCVNPPYVYNGSSNTESDFKYAGDDTSNCTLIIHNVQFSYSGEYKFRFITDKDKYTGDPGVKLQVADLKVSLISLSGSGTLKEGDSLNLTCDVNCTHSSSQFVWSKNNERLPASGPVLHFPALTLRDSGTYTCTWETDVTSGSETISLHLEDENFSPTWIFGVVITGVMVIFLVMLGAVIYNRRRKDNDPEDDDRNVETTTQVKQVPQPNEEVSEPEEVTYASVVVKANNLNNGSVHTEKKNNEISVIYGTVAMK